MKKLSALILALTMILALTACAVGTSSGSEPKETPESTGDTEPVQMKTIYILVSTTKTTIDPSTEEVLSQTVTTNLYDENGCLTRQDVVEDGELSYSMTAETDEYGRVIKLSVESSSIEYTYDQYGNTASMMYNTGAFTFGYTYTYDANGNCLTEEFKDMDGSVSLTKSVYEDGRVVRWEKYQDGELTQTNTYTYGEDGRIATEKIGNMATKDYTYSDDGLTTYVNCEKWHMWESITVDEQGNTVRCESGDAGQTDIIEYTYLAIQIPADWPRIA